MAMRLQKVLKIQLTQNEKEVRNGNLSGSLTHDVTEMYRHNLGTPQTMKSGEDEETLEENQLAELLGKALLEEPGTSEARAQLRELLDLDEMNLTYFLALYSQKKRSDVKEKIKIFDEKLEASGGNNEAGVSIAYPTAIAPSELLKDLPYVSYSSLQNEASKYTGLSQDIALWVKKTHGGGGTSILRNKYLSKLFGVPEDQVKLGAKGTDLFIPLDGVERPASLAEIQLLQALHEVRTSAFSEVYFHDIVSSESVNAIHELWQKKAPGRGDTYSEIAKHTKGFKRFGETYQSVLPTLDEKGDLSFNRKAPGGHAFFAVETLLNIARGQHIPETDRNLVAVIGNGEDLGSTPDVIMLGWMLKNNVPLVMITTEKTEIDLKGGQIALVKAPSANEIYTALIEQAQAKEAGQLKLFEDLGLKIKKPGQMSFFNTNVALFNIKVLAPKLHALLEEVGESEFLKIITPTLIENKKTQKDADGITRTYEQLEGAMGSTLLNLDRYWRKNKGEPLVHFINVERNYRTRFFSPIKTAFDFYMQFFSDRFSLDPASMSLVNHRSGHLPLVTLENPHDKNFYSEVDNILECFNHTKIKNLDVLEVKGPVNFSGVSLSGVIKVYNESHENFNVAQYMSETSQTHRLENVLLQISKGKVTMHDV